MSDVEIKEIKWSSWKPSHSHPYEVGSKCIFGGVTFCIESCTLMKPYSSRPELDWYQYQIKTTDGIEVRTFSDSELNFFRLEFL